MIIDSDLFREVDGAIWTESCMAVIKMFHEQSPVLLAGAINPENDAEVRAQSLHALKGMAQQLGLSDLGHTCKIAENALILKDNIESEDRLLSAVGEALASAKEALNLEFDRLS